MLSSYIFHSKGWQHPGQIALCMVVLVCWLVLHVPASGAQGTRARHLPLPDVSGPVSLRVAYVENPRFAPLPPARLSAILAMARKDMLQQLGVAVDFAPPAMLPIDRVLGTMSPALAKEAERARMDATLDPRKLERLVPTLIKDLRDAGDIAAQKRFAEGYLLHAPVDGSDRAFARALLTTHHGLLAQWGTTLALDGKPAIGKDRFNEYTYWNVVGSTPLPFEVLVTNQLIASAEKSENSVHSAIRGGLSNGITTQNRAGRYKLVSILSTYAFVDPGPLARKLRGGGVLTAEQEDLFMARLLVHELGHQLLHLGHPFDNPHCIMAPPKALEFQAWSAGLDPKLCALGSSKAQTPGYVQFMAPEALFHGR